MSIIILILLAVAQAAPSAESQNEQPPVVRSWISNKGYPAEARRHNWEGVAGFTVTVGVDGRVKSCIITKSTGHAVLDTATCEVITKRARFNPAINSDGETIEGTFSSNVRWAINR